MRLLRQYARFVSLLVHCAIVGLPVAAIASPAIHHAVMQATLSAKRQAKKSTPPAPAAAKPALEPAVAVPNAPVDPEPNVSGAPSLAVPPPAPVTPSPKLAPQAVSTPSVPAPVAGTSDVPVNPAVEPSVPAAPAPQAPPVPAPTPAAPTETSEPKATTAASFFSIERPTPTRTGIPGLYDTGSPALTHRFMLGSRIGSASSRSYQLRYLVTNTTSLYYSPLKWLGVFLAFDSQYNEIGSGGVDYMPGFVVGHTIDDWSFGASARMEILAGPPPLIYPSKGYGAQGRLLATYRIPTLPKPHRLMLHANLGYKYDQSAELYHSAELLQPNVAAASNIALSDAVLANLAVEYATVFMGASLEYIGKFLPESRVAGTGVLVPRVSFFLPLGFTMLLELPVRLYSTPTLAPQTPWLISLGLSWALQGTDLIAYIKSKQGAKDSRISRAQVIGQVRDEANNAPIYAAVVSFIDREASSLLTAEDGSYRSAELDRGPAKMEVRRLGYNKKIVLVDVPETGDVVMDVTIPAIPYEEYPVLKGRIEGESNESLKAIISFPKEPALKDVRHEVEGDYEVKVPPGKYAAVIQAPGKLTKGLPIDAAPKQVVEQPKTVMRIDNTPKVAFAKGRTPLPQVLNFKRGEAMLTARSEGMLEEVMHILLEHPTLKLIIRGHADEVGDTDINLEISQKRVDLVRDYLIFYGVDPTRLKGVAVGDDEPIDREKTESAQARNRRVELVVINE